MFNGVDIRSTYVTCGYDISNAAQMGGGVASPIEKIAPELGKEKQNSTNHADYSEP